MARLPAQKSCFTKRSIKRDPPRLVGGDVSFALMGRVADAGRAEYRAAGG